MDEIRHIEPGDSISKTFCVLPWVHLHTWPNGNVYPCCITDFRETIGNLKDSSLNQIWNDKPMMSIRKQMLNGDKPNTCRKCFEQEDHNLDSPRVTANRNFKESIKGITNNTDANGYNKDFKLHYWDFRFSNLCNFKCRTCGSGCSSKWFEDEYKLFGHNTIDRALIHVDDYAEKGIGYYVDEFIENVEEIYFAGGEPLLMDEHYYILEKLIEVGNTEVRLRYNTNLSFLKFKKWDILELWSNFKKDGISTVDIYASIDGVKEKGEYIRKGQNWKIVENNIKACIKNNLRFNISCTVSIFNILDIGEIHNTLVELGVESSRIGFYNVLTYPDYYHINILPDELKEIAISKLTIYLKKLDQDKQVNFTKTVNSLKSYIFSKPTVDVYTSRKNFKEYTLKLDKIRQENLKTLFPELWKWIDVKE